MSQTQGRAQTSAFPSSLPDRQVIERQVREALEEAGLGADITSQARLQGVVRVFLPLPEGLLIERLWTFSLRAPAGVTPSPNDGEVSAFERLTLEEIDRAWAAGGFNHEAAVASLCF